MKTNVFLTSDGFMLRQEVDGTWTDGDMTFANGPCGLPVDDVDGELYGQFICRCGSARGYGEGCEYCAQWAYAMKTAVVTYQLQQLRP